MTLSCTQQRAKFPNQSCTQQRGRSQLHPHPPSHLSPGPVLTTAADPDPDHDPEAPVPDTLTTTETLDPHLPLPETQIQLHLQPPQKRMKPQQQQLGGTKGVEAPGTETKHQKSRTRGGPVDPRLGQGQSLKLRSIFRFGTGPPYRPRKRPPHKIRVGSSQL